MVVTNRNISVKLRRRLFDSAVSITATCGLATCALTQQQRTNTDTTRSAMLRKGVVLATTQRRPGRNRHTAHRFEA
eukprot:8234904-Pyramimonas_sp.AAC.1